MGKEGIARTKWTRNTSIRVPTAKRAGVDGGGTRARCIHDKGSIWDYETEGAGERSYKMAKLILVVLVVGASWEEWIKVLFRVVHCDFVMYAMERTRKMDAFRP